MRCNGIMVGKTANSHQAQKMTTQYAECPYAALITHSGSTVIGLFTLPEDHTWWLKEIEKAPDKTLGFTYAEVFFTRNIFVESPWSMNQCTYNQKTAPCGSTCQSCSAYQKKCKGCPSTVHYE